MAPHSSTLAWKIPWTEEPGGLQSMGSLRVGHDWATSLSLFTCIHWRRKWQPIPVFLPGESQGQRSLLGCSSMGSHRVGHDWCDLAVAAATITWVPTLLEFIGGAMHFTRYSSLRNSGNSPIMFTVCHSGNQLFQRIPLLSPLISPLSKPQLSPTGDHCCLLTTSSESDMEPTLNNG